MGADFLLAVCEYPEDQDEARQRIENLSRDMLAMVAIETWGDVPREDSNWEQQVRDLLNASLDEVCRGRRDVVVIDLKGTTYAMTGGMSWGDDPSEAWSLVWALDISGVTRKGD